MPSFRLDEHACVYSEPTAIPHESAPMGCVFRPFNDLELAKEYADKVCAFFAEHGAAAPVFVVRGPTSTTNQKFEVVSATSTYTVEYRALPPGCAPRHKTFADAVLSNDATKSAEEQASLHFMAVNDMLNPRSSTELQDLSVKRCQAFLARGIHFMSPAHQGREGAQRQVLVQFLGLGWPERLEEDIEQLFRGYLRASMMPIHEELSDVAAGGEFVSAPSALRYAVDNSKTRLMVALLDEGADETLLPKSALAGPPNGEQNEGAGDLLSYIESLTFVNHTELLAAAREALLRRHIRQSSTSSVDEASTPQRRNQRASL
jgi:hypothetical protein